MEKLTHLSLFTGIGGIDLAAEAAGFETVCQCELDDFPTMILERRWPDVQRFKDIKTLTEEAFRERTSIHSVTLISGGFPCQPFSSAGKRRGFADERYLWPEMYRVIRELQPRWVLGENVAGFIKMGLDKTVFDLEKAGYSVRVFVLPACAVGAWHERKRTFIIGADVSDTGCLRYANGIEKHTDPCHAERNDSQTVKERLELGAQTIRSGSVFNADGAGGCGTQSVVGGMADGLSDWMDGFNFWEHEPDIPRLTKRGDKWAERLHALGNAVVPQQVFLILKAIANIETGRCRDWYGLKGGC